MMRRPQSGFTLVEMIVVIVITGIIGGIVATFLLAPVRGYTDLARRAELTDIADTALRRMSRDIRTALPNSVRVTVIGTTTYFEFLPTVGSGRYRASQPPGNMLDFTAADSSFDVLGPMPVFAAGDSVVIYNRGIAGANAYAGDNTGTYSANTATTVTINPAKLFPFKSPGNRFQVINTPVTYECAPATDAAGNGTGTLTRWQGYAIQAVQPVAPPGGTTALLANRVSACTLSYGPIGRRLALVTLQLTLADSGEIVTLYSSTHISNVP